MRASPCDPPVVLLGLIAESSAASCGSRFGGLGPRSLVLRRKRTLDQTTWISTAWARKLLVAFKGRAVRQCSEIVRKTSLVSCRIHAQSRFATPGWTQVSENTKLLGPGEVWDLCAFLHRVTRSRTKKMHKFPTAPRPNAIAVVLLHQALTKCRTWGDGVVVRSFGSDSAVAQRVPVVMYVFPAFRGAHLGRDRSTNGPGQCGAGLTSVTKTTPFNLFGRGQV
jgi:hypothetical protein